jgi:hypothetical protein
MTTEADKAVANAFRAKGWIVLDRGWPDLLVYQDNRVMAVELKRGQDRLRPEQREMSDVFCHKLGVPYYVARDADIEAILRKKGRVVVPPNTLGTIKSEMDDLRRQIADLNRTAANVGASVEEATTVFDPLRSEVDPSQNGGTARSFGDLFGRAMADAALFRRASYESRKGI